MLGVLALAALAGLARTAEPSGQASKGRVLLLENERTLEGDVERVGDQYRVRRVVGETWVPAGKVHFLGETREDAYAYLRSRANLRDPDERLRLARWCHLHDLRDKALAEVAAAVQLRPDHEPTQRLLAGLQRSAAVPQPPPPAPSRDHPEPAPALAPPAELNQESLGQFVTRVQPILFNTCASCHASGRGGSFKLVRPVDGDATGRKPLHQNLTAVLAQLNFDQPQASPLLTKALSVHGEMRDPPLKGRQLAAYQTLEDWVRRTAASHAHLRQARATGTATPALPEARPVVESRPVKPEAPPEPSPTLEEPPKQAPMEPVDPFDPVIFNRQMHPGR